MCQCVSMSNASSIKKKKKEIVMGATVPCSNDETELYKLGKAVSPLCEKCIVACEKDEKCLVDDACFDMGLVQKKGNPPRVNQHGKKCKKGAC
jgi:hypothetical protein